MSHKMASSSSSSYFSEQLQYNAGGGSDTSSSGTPHLIKPSIVTSTKQRSSSMNSITSNHSIINASGISNTSTVHPIINNTSTTVRSLSIISLESPRNSIVSIDENLIRPTRNNSTTSLASLNAQQPTAFINNPTTLSQLHHHASTSINDSPKVRTMINTSAILSDDDSEFEISTPIAPALAARSILKPVFKLKKNSEQMVNLKKDFKFKYDDFTQSNRVPTTPSSPSTNNGYQSSSPTSSVTLANLSTALRNLQDITPSPLSLEKISNESLTAKKKKSSSLIQHSILKKKSIYSKDLQFELTNTNPNASISTSLKSIETKFVNSNNNTSNNNNNNNNDSISVDAISDEPIMKTLKEQNKLIHKLNRKWNKGVHFDHKDKDDKSGKGSPTTPTNEVSTHTSAARKRSRDSFDTDDDNNYDDYDDYDV
ncbi:hypothetical protein DFJ63DRAFT_5842 [Scheffersomyces coipomensis]|uniref:uncharacterized protein n=1 Tax=Scheffersomyces coipomensis TaxID=1788519 RepID=UPI00315C6294